MKNPLSPDFKRLTPIILITLLLTGFISNLQAQRIRFLYNDDVLNPNTSIDNLLEKLEKKKNEAILKNDTSLLIKTTIALCSTNRTILNYAEALNLGGEAVFLAEEYKDPLLLARSNEEYGILLYIFRQNDIAGFHLMTSLKYYKEALQKKMVKGKEMFFPHYNLIFYYHRLNDFKQVNNYLDLCYNYFETTDIDPVLKIALDAEKAILLNNDGLQKEAEELILKNIEILDKIKPTSTYNIVNKRLLTDLNYTLARVYEDTGRYKEAKQHFEKALSYIKLNGEQAISLSYMNSKYAYFLKNNDDFKNAFFYLDRSRRITEKYTSPRRSSNQSYLSVKNKYKEELLRKDSELNHKNLLLAQNKQQILRFRIFFFITLFILIIIGLVIRSRMLNLKHDREKKTQQEQLDLSTEQLELKNRELTATMLQLIEKEEMFNKINEHLQQDNNPGASIALINSLKKQSTNLWDTFNNQFIELNKGFYERLQEKYTNLNSSDLKVCALIKLNFSGQEMASLLGVSLGAIHQSRHRLRKKMDIARDVNLTVFINSI